MIADRCEQEHLSGILSALEDVDAIVARGKSGIGVFEGVADCEAVDDEFSLGEFAFAIGTL